ncbi:alpha-amylase family glycosyl hydrolase [Alkalihalobacillus pseudalcaliphilus]|uniref:alpha-amylase family glycosyl hydrolase n=1 Tax=Alkalihalobacillus pseudalcaliphilus TaxID=79884 RepID=UPI00069E8409|nr:alpha-amylase family glycosyl hydrolase [Alkalihalobacillus pseudalcaliphilus]
MLEKWSKYMLVLLVSIVFITACSPADETDSELEDDDTEEVDTVIDDSNEMVDLADIDQQYNWALESIFYQIFVRSFYDADGDGVGDFAGIEQNLDYIQELGANALWLMPMKESKSYHGYDVMDYYEVEGQYGTMEEFESLLSAAHERDMKVIIDFVVNHTSDEHSWFQEAIADENSEYRDYYIWDDHESYAGQEPNGEQGWHEVEGKIYSGHFNVDMPDLNYDNPEVRQEVKDIASFWLEKGVDGFRIDAVADIYEDRNETIEWWREFNTHVKSVNPEAFIVGETWYHAWDDISYYYSALESNFNFVLTEEIIGMANGMNVDIVSALNDVKDRYQRFSGARGNALVIDSTMIGNHDMDRVHTRLGSEGQAKLAASILFTLPGTPFIYYGDELGQEGQRPDDNRREPFQWYAAAEGAGMTTMDEHFFNPSQYTHPNDGTSLEEQQGTEGSMYEHYKKMIEIRQSHPMFFAGTYTAIGTDLGLYGYTVEGDEDYQLTVIHNQRKEAKTVQVVLNDSEELVHGHVYQDGELIEIAPYETIIVRSPIGQLPIEEVEVEIPEEDFAVTFRVTLPETTPDGEEIYLVGEFNNWNEADPEMVMEQIDDDTYEKTIEGRAFEMVEFKFTRGDWSKREQNSEGQDLVGDRQTQNRVYTFEEEEKVEELIVEKWSDIE